MNDFQEATSRRRVSNEQVLRAAPDPESYITIVVGEDQFDAGDVMATVGDERGIETILIKRGSEARIKFKFYDQLRRLMLPKLGEDRRTYKLMPKYNIQTVAFD